MFISPYVATTGVGAGGLTYFFEERFEGTGYTNSWTESGTGTIDEDYTTTPLEGAQSLRIAASNQSPLTVANLPSDQSELWAYFRFRINTDLSAGPRQIIALRNTGATAVGNIQLNPTNQLLVANGTIATTATTDAMTTGSDYHVWFHWKKGTGANGTCSVAFSASGTEPTSGTAFKSLANGNSTTDAHDLRIGFTTSSICEFVIDQILFSTTGTIGNSPA